MYTTRMIDDKEKDRYMNFIRNHPQGHFLQSFEWGEVGRSMEWTPLPLILEKDGQIQGALLILKKKLPLPLINKCIFYAPRGPVVDLESEELCQVLFAGASKAADDHGAIFLKIDPDVADSNPRIKDTLRKCGFKKSETRLELEGTQAALTCRLDITSSEVKLMENMSFETKHNVKMAHKKGVRIREVSGKEELLECYEILKARSPGDPFLRSYRSFETLWDEMGQKRMATILMAEYEDRIISSSLIFRLGEKAWSLFAASRQQDASVIADDLMQWEIIKWSREQGCTLYDFKGVSQDWDTRKPLNEQSAFIKGFNGVLTELVGEWDTVYSPFYCFLWKHFMP